MTFEQWWADNCDEFMHLAHAAPALGDDFEKRFQAACWDAAIDAALDRMNGFKRAVLTAPADIQEPTFDLEFKLLRALKTS